jgi:hypothetical protein
VPRCSLGDRVNVHLLLEKNGTPEEEPEGEGQAIQKRAHGGRNGPRGSTRAPASPSFHPIPVESSCPSAKHREATCLRSKCVPRLTQGTYGPEAERRPIWPADGAGPLCHCGDKVFQVK